VFIGEEADCIKIIFSLYASWLVSCSELIDVIDIEEFARIILGVHEWKEKVQRARDDYHVRNAFIRLLGLR
jgi:hypothetical protein